MTNKTQKRIETINKVVCIGSSNEGNVYCKIQFDNKKLSISGVVGPKSNGNCRGSCGQIYESFAIDTFCDGWNSETLTKFVDVWKHWHLNDMRAGCEHQRDTGIANISFKNHPDGLNGLIGKPCPVCGYEYGSKWLHEDVPQDILYFLNALPKSKLTPAWI
jgi:hypothetical protein